MVQQPVKQFRRYV